MTTEKSCYAGQVARIKAWEGRPFDRWFALSAGGALGVTGAAKVWSAFGSSKLLAVVDPILGIRFGHLMLLAGLVEIIIALVCFFGKRKILLATALVAWISTGFTMYRLGLWWMDWHRPCNCLGNLTDTLHISSQAADSFTKVLLTYLVIGSYTGLLLNWRENGSVKQQV